MIKYQEIAFEWRKPEGASLHLSGIEYSTTVNLPLQMTLLILIMT